MATVEVVHQALHEQQDVQRGKLLSSDVVSDCLAIAFLLIWGLSFHGVGLGALEFFRHTEADRTLIAWEMLDRGEYLVPHLLGSEILTKPPLFYWLQAVVFQISGEVSEFSARLVSAGNAVLFLLVHYAFLRRGKCSPQVSFLGSIILSTSILFFILASVAEIDLTYGLFCSLALYASYLSTTSHRLHWTLFAYFFVALAFLTKGPPVVLLFGVPHLLFFLLKLRDKRVSLSRFVGWNICGVLLASLVVGVWLVLLARQVGWEALSAQFRVEIVERIFNDSTRNRGAFFYLRSCFVNLGHWCIFPLAAVVMLFRERSFARQRWEELPVSYRDLLCFSALTLVSALVLLSFAEGKSNRYLFPVHSFLTVVATLCAYLIRGSKTADWLLRPFAVVFGFVCAIGVLLTPLVLSVPNVPSAAMYSVGIPMAAALVLLGFFARKSNTFIVLTCVALVVFTVRLGQAEIFAPHRNAKKTAKPAVWAIQELLPPTALLYTLEMSERWVAFYLKQQSRKVQRLTPNIADRLAGEGGRAFLLLNEKEEGWRILQLKSLESELRLVARLNERNRPLLLVETTTRQLPLLNLRKLFPTTPSKPPENLTQS